MDFLRDGSTDAAVMVWALHHMDKPLSVLKEARRVLRPGGKMLVLEMPPGLLAKRLWNENYFSASQVGRLFIKAGFCDVRVKPIERRQVIWAVGFRPPHPSA